jgi:hypothetical protein
VAALAAMLDNPFEVASIRGIRVGIALTYGAPVEELVNLRVPTQDIRAGDLIHLELSLRGRRGDERIEVLPIRVPDDAGGESVHIEVTGGDFVRPYRAIPNSLDDLISNIESVYPSRSLVASIYREKEGLATRHGLIEDMPDSVIETLQELGATRSSVRVKQLARRVIPTDRFIEGSHTLKLDILPRQSL